MKRGSWAFENLGKLIIIIIILIIIIIMVTGLRDKMIMLLESLKYGLR